jgi:hypothetical protein
MLKIFNGRPVSIFCPDGKIYFGIVDDYFYPEDTENNEESIILKRYNNDLIKFRRSDISKISMAC